MRAYGALSKELAQRFDGLPTKQRRVARLIAEDGDFVAFASVEQVADAVGVHPSTAVRACQSLGYSGWRALKADLQKSLRERLTFAERTGAMPSSGGDSLEGAMVAAIHNVGVTFDQLAVNAVHEVAAAIEDAGSIVVLAGGASLGPGEILNSSLQLLGYRSTLSTSGSEAGAALAALAEGDLVIGISVWRYLRFTVDALRLASEFGLNTLAITDSVVSSAALVADRQLLASASAVGPRAGMTGILALVEVLIATVAQRDPHRSAQATERADRLYREGGLLHLDEDPGHH